MKCLWIYHNRETINDYWSTSCGDSLDTFDIGRREVKICPFCGKEVTTDKNEVN